MANGREKLIVALDILDEKKCFDMIDALSPEVDIFKVGIAPFTAFGQKILDKLNERGKKIFLDLKFHDIPNTVKNASYAAACKNVFMVNFHCSGGKDMLLKAVEGAEKAVKETKKPRPLLLGVTVLTSMSAADVSVLGGKGNVEDKVIEYALLAKEAGLDGVVASAEETKKIKEKCGKSFVVVTPGIRPAGSVADDQKRVVTAADAIKNGSDYIVVGRPIIEAASPVEAARSIIREIEEQY